MALVHRCRWFSYCRRYRWKSLLCLGYTEQVREHGCGTYREFEEIAPPRNRWWRARP